MTACALGCHVPLVAEWLSQLFDNLQLDAQNLKQHGADSLCLFDLEVCILLYLLVHEFIFASEVPLLEVKVVTSQLILALNEEKRVLLMFGLNAFMVVRGKGKGKKYEN